MVLLLLLASGIPFEGAQQVLHSCPNGTQKQHDHSGSDFMGSTGQFESTSGVEVVECVDTKGLREGRRTAWYKDGSVAFREQWSDHQLHGQRVRLVKRQCPVSAIYRGFANPIRQFKYLFCKDLYQVEHWENNVLIHHHEERRSRWTP